MYRVLIEKVHSKAVSVFKHYASIKYGESSGNAPRICNLNIEQMVVSSQLQVLAVLSIPPCNGSCLVCEGEENISAPVGGRRQVLKAVVSLFFY